MLVPGELPLIPLSPAHELAVAAISTPLAALLIGAGRNVRKRMSNNRKVAEDAGLRALIAALDARDHYTGNHSEAVVRLAVGVAKNMRLHRGLIKEAEQVAFLHDIGKIGIPDRVLLKAGPLTDDEWEIMRTHPIIGERMIASIETLSHLAPKLRAEHERWDGTGYPDGLSGRQIPVVSRVILACDAYHAMVSDRPYRTAITKEAAVGELVANAGRQFCPSTVKSLLQVLH